MNPYTIIVGLTAVFFPIWLVCHLLSTYPIFFAIVFGLVIYFAVLCTAIGKADKEDKRLRKAKADNDLKDSERLKQLREINRKYCFQNAGEKQCNCALTSRLSFNKFNPEVFLMDTMMRDSSAYERCFKMVDEDTAKYSSYLVDISKICPSQYTQGSTLAKRENELFREELKKPLANVGISVRWLYRTPAGNILEDRTERVSAKKAKVLFEKAKTRASDSSERRERIRLERLRMTDSLRWDILKRDGYRCVVCGATADDGVKLHVDHIVPVSKGGKTIPSNLQTLCERCNLGKSDKID